MEVIPSGEAPQQFASGAQVNGIDFIPGDAGFVRKLLCSDQGGWIGVLTANGQAHLDDLVIFCTKEHTATVLNAKHGFLPTLIVSASYN